MPEVEDVTLRIAGREWRAWNGLEIKRVLDGFSTVGFDAVFEPTRADFRQSFRPFSYQPIDLAVNGARLFTGTMVVVAPNMTTSESSVRVGAYSLPTVLGDVNIPASKFPLEFNGLRLHQIAAKLAEPFGLRVEMDGDPGAAFRRVALKPEENPLKFLAELARQRGYVIADTADGALRILRSARAGNPVVSLREGEAPLLSVAAAFSPQDYYSEITGLAKTRVGSGGHSYTERNPKLTGVVRPHVFQLSDTDGPDLPTAVKAKLGRMFGNMVAYTIEVPTWRDPRGNLWTPNTTILLEAPSAMVYSATELLVREVTLRQDSDAHTATLVGVLPGAFSGEVPARLPWE